MGCPWILRVRLLSRHPQKRSYHKFEDEAKLLEHIEACSEPSEATTETFHVGSLYNYEPDHRFDANDNDTTSDEENKDGAPGAWGRCRTYQEASERDNPNWEPPESYEDSDVDDSIDVTQAKAVGAPEVGGEGNAAYERAHSVTRSWLRWPGEEVPAYREVPEASITPT